MTTELSKVIEKAKADRRVRFTSLVHLLTLEFLKEAWGLVNKPGAQDVDGKTIKDLEEGLNAQLEDLHQRLRAGSYRAPAVRRVHIPKEPGKTQPLEIPTVEDRLVQAAVARIPSAVFEPVFCDSSFGYQPGRSAHDALRRPRSYLIGGKVMHVYEADIRSHFDRVNHEWRHLILDNFSPHGKTEVRTWCRRNVVHLIGTPTNASWLNPIDCQFTPVKEFVIRNTHYLGHKDSADALRRYTHHRNRDARKKAIEHLLKRH